MVRDALLARYRVVHTTIEQGAWDEPSSDLHALRLLVDERLDLHDAYAQSLVPTALARCPFTDEALSSTIDLAGFDGLWWSAELPVRPSSPEPDSFLGLAGAAHLVGPLPETPFSIRPGPDRPFVVPSVLAQDGVVAVIRQLQIGAVVAHAVCYFAEGGARGRRPPPTWGLMPLDVDPADRDADLGPWIERDRLLWVRPGDASLALQGGEVGCPFVGLDGDDRDIVVFEGQTWRVEPEPHTAAPG